MRSMSLARGGTPRELRRGFRQQIAIFQTAVAGDLWISIKKTHKRYFIVLAVPTISFTLN